MVDELENEIAAAKQGYRVLGRLALAFALALVTVYGAVLLGRILAEWVLSAEVRKIAGIPIEVGLSGVGLSFVINSFRQILVALERFATFVRKGSERVRLYPDCITLGGIVAFVTVVGVLVAAPDNDQPPEVTADLAEVLYLVPSSSKPSPLATFPILFEELATADWSRGVELSESQRKRISRMVESLNACVGSEKGQDVVLRIRGFADSNEFPSHSDSLNRDAANRRAQSIAAAIRPLLAETEGSPSLKIDQVVQWATFEEMAGSKPYRDLPLRETGGKDQGFFNRRAEIALMSAGACQKLVPTGARRELSDPGASLVVAELGR